MRRFDVILRENISISQVDFKSKNDSSRVDFRRLTSSQSSRKFPTDWKRYFSHFQIVFQENSQAHVYGKVLNHDTILVCPVSRKFSTRLTWSQSSEIDST